MYVFGILPTLISGEFKRRPIGRLFFPSRCTLRVDFLYISAYLDVSRARRPEQELKRVNVDFPLWMIQQLDKEARRLGVPRQAIIKVWVAERLEKAG